MIERANLSELFLIANYLMTLMKTDVPFLFSPFPQPRIWGGDKLCGAFFEKFLGQTGVGESWELGFMPGFDSELRLGIGGTLGSLLRSHPLEVLGPEILSYFGVSVFPLLVKFIDAKKKLSVQVHPRDELAKARHQSFGKSEMWYVLDAEPNAQIIAGFKPGIDQQTYLHMLQKGSLTEALQHISVSRGDVIYIPAGLIHAIGEGVLLVEIQQPSDITYRIYDWDRVDAEGKSRELHTELALEAIHFLETPYRISISDYARDDHAWVTVLATPHFNFSVLELKGGSVSCVAQKSFAVYICVAGEISISKSGSATITLTLGMTALIPFGYGAHQVSCSSKARLLRATVGDSQDAPYLKIEGV